MCDCKNQSKAFLDIRETVSDFARAKISESIIINHWHVQVIGFKL